MKTASKRQYSRIHFTNPITVVELWSDVRRKVAAIDVSLPGMAFRYPEFVVPGRRVRIHVWLEQLNAEDPVGIEATVRWVQPVSEEVLVGVKFDNLLTRDEHPDLYNLIEQKSASAPATDQQQE